MSSKEQYRDLVKRKDETIRQLNYKIYSKDQEIKHLNQRLTEVRGNMKKLIDSRWGKKWWQFWK